MSQSRITIYQIGLSVGEVWRKIKIVFCVWGGFDWRRRTSHRTHQLLSWLWRMGWPRSGFTALRDFLSSDQSLYFPSLCCSGWSDQTQMRSSVLLQRSSKGILPWTHSLKLIIWLLSSSQQRLTGPVWVWPGSTPANQRGETSPTTVFFNISLFWLGREGGR